MQTIIMSIKPQYWNKIASGKKTVEFRKRVWKDHTLPTKVIVYATQPIGKIVGEFITDNIISDRCPKLWSQTKDLGGISSYEYFDYFVESEIAHAIAIKNVKIYPNAESIRGFTHNQINRAPQSWQYFNQ